MKTTLHESIIREIIKRGKITFFDTCDSRKTGRSLLTRFTIKHDEYTLVGTLFDSLLIKIDGVQGNGLTCQIGDHYNTLITSVLLSELLSLVELKKRIKKLLDE